jgi:integrase
MKTAVVEGMIARSPCIGVDLPRDRRREMAFLSADATEPRYPALINFGAYTGLRWGELAALRASHLNLLRGTVEVSESLSEINGHLEVGPTKTGTRRSISAPGSSTMVGEHIGRYPSPEGFVFSAPAGGPLRRASYRRSFKPAVRAAGLDPELRFHDLRHTCVGLLIERGAHAKEIAERLGHSTVRLTLDRYAYLLLSLD